MIKQIISVILLLALALGLYSLAKTFSLNKQQVNVPTEEEPKGKLPEGSTPVGEPLAIQNQTWIWVETISNNDTSVIPNKIDAFTLTLGTDESVSIKTDCNTYAGRYDLGSDGVISFGPLAGTKMFCEGSQENIFTNFVSKASRYTLDVNGNLVLLLTQDSGSVMFKKAELINKKSYEKFGNEVSYDFNQDGVKDTGYISVEKSEGSGTFYYFTSSINGTKPFFIGDRIAPQSTEIDKDGVVILNYADRKPDESFATPPSVGKTIRLKFDIKSKMFIDISNSIIKTI